MRYIYFCFLLAFVYVLLNSHSSGAGAVQLTDRTGSPLGSGSCANCHIGGAFQTEVEAQLFKDSLEVQEYIPGEAYTLRVQINTINNPLRYGFQAVSLQGQENIDAGTFSNIPEGTRLTTINNRTYFEHATKLPEPTIETEWIAPEAGSGEVRFYVAANAVNNVGGSTGDTPDQLDEPLLISESITSNTNEIDQLGLSWTLFPNPAHDYLTAQLQVLETGLYQFRIVDQQNRLLQQQALRLQQGEQGIPFQVNELPKGLYFLQLIQKGQVVSRKFIKL